MRKQRVWRIAVAGNVAALFLLTLIFAQGPLFFSVHEAVPRAVVTRPLCVLPVQHRAHTQASRVVVIVVDALRLDQATDRHLMPTLAALAQQGNSGVAIVETLIPSTVAAIQALVSGVIVPPLAFVEDFTASPATHGGILAAIQGCGGQTFVAGPRLWTDLYGAWIHETVTSDGFAEDDARLLAATVAALDKNQQQFLVVHFSRPDHAAHQYGALSQEYRHAVRWCDTAIAQILQHVDPTTAVVITADHGVTRRGGHAGLEPAVRVLPLVTWGPGVTATAPAMPQAALPLLLRAALQPTALAPVLTHPEPLSWPLRGVLGVLLACALLSVHRIFGGLHLEADGTPPDAVLNASVWLALILSYSGAWLGAVVLGAFMLIVTALRMPVVPQPGLLLALGVGCLFGCVRLLDGAIAGGQEVPDGVVSHAAPWSAALLIGVPLVVVSTHVPSRRLLYQELQGWQWVWQEERRWLLWPFAPLAALVAYSVGGSGLVPVVLLTLCGGAFVGQCLLTSVGYSPIRVGIMAALLPAVSARLAGETVSLSTIDVHVAFSLADSAVGLPGAIVVALVRQAVLSVCVCVSVAWALRTIPPADFGRFVAGFAAMHVAQALPVAMLLSISEKVDLALVALALGAVLHILNEVIFCFLTLAAASFIASRKK